MRNANLESLVQKYGPVAKIDKVLCDQYRLTLKTQILKAWSRRRLITTHVVGPLTCYNEVMPYEHNGLMMIDPIEKQYKDKVKLVFRDFPIDQLHPTARKAHDAAREVWA